MLAAPEIRPFAAIPNTHRLVLVNESKLRVAVVVVVLNAVAILSHLILIILLVLIPIAEIILQLVTPRIVGLMNATAAPTITALALVTSVYDVAHLAFVVGLPVGHA